MNTACCIAGGGPAGIMLGYLLARAGVDVVVLEKHADFFRDFRGDTIHPSTFQLMHELGLLSEFLKVPHQEIKLLTAQFNDITVPIADFSHLPAAKAALGIMPQWDFLNFLSRQAATYPSFKLLLETEAKDLLRENGRIVGVIAQTKTGAVEIRASLVVGTDGRGSIIREKAGLRVIDNGAPIDVVWFRVSRRRDDPPDTFGRVNNGRIMVLIDRNDYWQCAYVIPKGDFERIKQRGIDHFRGTLKEVSPFLADRFTELKDWSDVSLLAVKIDHLQKWYTHGVLCIGDAAHAMSPIGGVGINLAVQDAVAAANILYTSLKKKETVPLQVLAKVQKRRAFPAWVIQRMQVYIQNGIFKRALEKNSRMPLPFRILRHAQRLRRLPARLVGMGVRPEHIKTPDSRK